jgi:hypothetical protein
MVGWTWAAASRRGTSHEKTGTKRQDAMRVLLASDKRTLIAIACDGAGSASMGGEGAAIAARTLSNCAKAALGRKGVPPGDSAIWEWIDLARDRIAAVAARRDLMPRDFATTVVMAISDGRETLALHVGDGAVIARDAKSGEWRVICWPEHGEYAATTFFLTDDGDIRARIVRHGSPLDRLAVFTDGIERLALDFTANIPHTPFFAGVSEPVAKSPAKGCDVALSAKLGEYLASDAVNARTDDDKTLILASRE